MTHDPLCFCASHKQPHIQYLSGVCHYCQCATIEQVRADERAKLVEVMGQISHQSADQGTRVMVFVGEPVNGSVLVWRDGRLHWENPQ